MAVRGVAYLEPDELGRWQGALFELERRMLYRPREAGRPQSASEKERRAEARGTERVAGRLAGSGRVGKERMKEKMKDEE